MENASQLQNPIRVGIFSSIDDADHAVAALLESGFTAEEITVVCSNKAIEGHYHRFEHQEPAGSHTASAVTAGSAIGAALGGLTAVSAAVANTCSNPYPLRPGLRVTGATGSEHWRIRVPFGYDRRRCGAVAATPWRVFGFGRQPLSRRWLSAAGCFFS
ncbi:MAG TPA: hypothetical protein VND64_20890 [Pirellulales bacterium]|nr:hypothetical protein [Pirellulales bacterium]